MWATNGIIKKFQYRAIEIRSFRVRDPIKHGHFDVFWETRKRQYCELFHQTPSVIELYSDVPDIHSLL